MKKYMILIVIMTIVSTMTGCASAKLSGRSLRQHKVYKCTMRLIQEEADIKAAEEVCSNIYTNKRRRK